MNDWILVNETQPKINERVLICEIYSDSKDNPPMMTVSYWDGSFDEYNGIKMYKFPDEQDEQPGFWYPTHWMPLPPPPHFNQQQ
jgi:hypothetical protein